MNRKKEIEMIKALKKADLTYFDNVGFEIKTAKELFENIENINEDKEFKEFSQELTILFNQVEPLEITKVILTSHNENIIIWKEGK